MAIEVDYPFAPIKVKELADQATIDVAVESREEYLQVSNGLSQTSTLNLTADESVPKGAKVFIDVQQGGSGNDLQFGSGGDTIVAADLTGVANDRDVIELVYNGSEWVAKSDWYKVTDAA